MSEELRGVVVCHGRLAGALVDAAEQISGVTGALWCRCRTPAATAARSRSGWPRRWAAGPAVVFVDLASGSCLFAVLNRLARQRGRQGGDRREPGDAGGLRLPPDAPARRGGGAGGHRRRPRPSGFPDGDRALPGGRPAGPRPGGDRLGPPARGGLHRAGGRGRGRQPVGAGPLSHGGPARDRDPLRHHRRGGGAAARSGRRASGAACCSPATSRPWRRSTAPTPAVVHRINLGGVHHRPGRRERLPYLYLTDDELRALVALEARRARRSPPRTFRPRRRWRSERSDERARPARGAAAPGLGHDRRPRSGERAAGHDRRGRSWPGAVAGWLAGDVEAGLRVGVLLELFALDVLPIGAVRYPDYGPATVVGAALAAGAPWELGLGLSAAVALVLAVVGGLEPAIRAAAQRAGHPAPGRGAGRGRERGHPPAPVRWRSLRDAAPRRGADRAGDCSPPAAIARWIALDRQTAVGLTLVAVGAGPVGGGRRRGAERGTRRPAQVAGGRRGWRDRCWRCCGERRVARAAAAARGAGHVELRAHARRRHGLRRRAAARGPQDRRPRAARRGGGAIGGVLQLQSQPGGPRARRHGAGGVRSGARRADRAAPDRALQPARRAGRRALLGRTRAGAGRGWRSRPPCWAPAGGRSSGCCSPTTRSGSPPRSGRSGPGSTRACGWAPRSGRRGSRVPWRGSARWRARAVGLAIPLAAGWYLRGFGWAGAVGALAVAAVGAAVTRWFGPPLTSVRFALLAMALLLFFRWVGL